MISEFRELSRSLGFVAAGFSRPVRPPHADFLRRWILSGKHGEMAWLSRNWEIREDPTLLLKGCRTVVSLAFPYASAQSASPEGLSVARYASPFEDDYHEGLKERCAPLSRFIKERFPGSRTRVCVDSAPLMERDFACLSGVGFIGKNTQLIVPGLGSYVFLAEILTTAELSETSPARVEDGCGECTRCLEACPTGALEAHYSVDASRCLSYLTIEWRGDVDRETGLRMGNCFLGCDRCQEVCPHNGPMRPHETVLPPASRLMAMDRTEFDLLFGRTALARAGISKIRSNLKAVGVRVEASC